MESTHKTPTEPEPLASLTDGSPLLLRLKNVFCSVALVFLAAGAYCIAPFAFHRKHTGALYGPPDLAISGQEFLIAAAFVYSAALAVLYLTRRTPHVSKSLRFFHVAARFIRSPGVVSREGLSAADRLAVLSTLLKGFFGPLMALIVLQMCAGVVVAAMAIREVGLSHGTLAVFNRYGYWLAFQVIIFVDVFVFTVGYLIESRRLGNEIRSVDATASTARPETAVDASVRTFFPAASAELSASMAHRHAVLVAMNPKVAHRLGTFISVITPSIDGGRCSGDNSRRSVR